MLLNGEDVSDEIRRPEVTRTVGAFADLPRVRRALIEHQQRLGRSGGVVADGRDAGTVVFPDADLKIVMTADLEERARRRFPGIEKKGGEHYSAAGDCRHSHPRPRGFAAGIRRRHTAAIPSYWIRRACPSNSRSAASLPWRTSAACSCIQEQKNRKE